MKSKKPVQKPKEIKTKDDIKTLYEFLKNARIVQNWEEFSEKVNYNRTHVSRVVNGHEDLHEDLKKAITAAFIDATKHVGSESGGKKENVRLYIPENEFQKMVLEELREIKATVKIMKLTVAKHELIYSSSKSTIPVTLLKIEEQVQAIDQLIKVEADMLLAKDKEKYSG